MDSGTSIPTVMAIFPLSSVAVGADTPFVTPSPPDSPPLGATATPLLLSEEDEEEEDEEEEDDDDVAVAEANDDVADGDAE